jgi:hypothetical protein
MFSRRSAVILVSCSALLLAACSRGTAPKPDEPAPPGKADVTFYVEGMVERQNIT